MRFFKLLVERVMSRDFDRQVAELQIKAAILNRFTALGPPYAARRIGLSWERELPAFRGFAQQSP